MILHRLINIVHDLIAVNNYRRHALDLLAQRNWIRHIRYVTSEQRNVYGYPIPACRTTTNATPLVVHD